MNRNVEQAEFIKIMKLKTELREVIRKGENIHSKRTLMLLREFYTNRTGKSAYMLLYFPKELRNECIKLKTNNLK
jgi:hypothetical protein